MDNILGYDTIKNYLQASVEAGRIPHAQLFVASEGQGGLPMAIASSRTTTLKQKPNAPNSLTPTSILLSLQRLTTR